MNMINILTKLFTSKKIDVTESSKRVIEETKVCNACLQFIIDSGNYKKSALYKLSSYDLKQRVFELRTQFLTLQTNMIIADIVIRSNKKTFKKYLKLSEDINAEIMREKQEVLKKTNPINSKPEGK